MILCSFKTMHFHYTVENLLFYLVLIATYCLKLSLFTGEKNMSSFRAKEHSSSKRGFRNARWERLGGKVRKQRLYCTARNGRKLIRAGADRQQGLR